MTPMFLTAFGLTTRTTNIDAQKIDVSSLKIYDMVSERFSLQNSLKRVWFFKQIFLQSETSMKMVFEIFFLALSIADIKFDAGKLISRKYTVMEGCPIARQIELINMYKFMEVALDEAFKLFIVSVTILEAPMLIMITHTIKKTFISDRRIRQSFNKSLKEIQWFSKGVII